uniref:Uncharacterized protein n=1 Tax=Glossina morsitans morsitans TaxID=37546 RepID=A0ABK9NG55_GLOMM
MEKEENSFTSSAYIKIWLELITDERSLMYKLIKKGASLRRLESATLRGLEAYATDVRAFVELASS